jgi:hypothetical protein
LCSCISLMRLMKKKSSAIWYFLFAFVILHFNKTIQWMCIVFMKAMWWLINLYMFFISCAKNMAQIWNLIIVRKFNENIARTITLVNWCVLSKDIKFICNTFIWDLFIEFCKALEKKFSLVAIPSIGSLQCCFQQS